MGKAQQGAMSSISDMSQYTPQFQQAYYSQAGNAYAPQAVQGAQAGGAAMQQQGGQNVATANTFAGTPQQLAPFIQSTLNTAYDPQSALYSQERQANTDYSNAALAQSGLSFTPWATGVSTNADQTFNTNWTATQLGREQAGAGTAATLLGAGEGAATTGAALGNQGAGQIAQGAALPYEAQTGINQDIASMLPYLTANQQQQVQDYLSYYGAANQNASNAVSSGQAQDKYATGIGSGVGQLFGGSLGSSIYKSLPSMASLGL